MRPRAVLVVSLAAGAIVTAQDRGPITERQLFRSAVDLVRLHVTVTNSSGEYLTGIPHNDFVVLENGRPQQLKMFQEGGLPLSIAVLLDTSASMQSEFPDVQNAAVTFLEHLRPEDLACVVGFGDTVRIAQGFTADRAALESAVHRTTTGGGTALYDAVYIALKDLSRMASDGDGLAPRQYVAVILSDGEDSASLTRFEDVLELATRSDIAIYALSMGRSRSSQNRAGESEFVLRRLARHTGGRAFFALNRDQLSRVYDDIRTELARRYVLAYVSNDPRQDGAFRPLSVRIRRDDAVARTKQGYYATRAPMTAR